jgi:hypothetical protein
LVAALVWSTDQFLKKPGDLLRGCGPRKGRGSVSRKSSSRNGGYQRFNETVDIGRRNDYTTFADNVSVLFDVCHDHGRPAGILISY